MSIAQMLIKVTNDDDSNGSKVVGSLPGIVKLGGGVVQLGEDIAGNYGDDGLEHSQHGKHLQIFTG